MYTLHYRYVANILEKRLPFSLHIEHINKAPVLLGGAYNPPLGAMIIFKGWSREQIDNFAKNDPYVLNKLVTDFTINEYTCVSGSLKDKE